jgi:hypothetical protein
MGKKTKEINERWQLLATQLGVNFRPSTFFRLPKMEGTYKNHQFKLWVTPGSQYSPLTTWLRINLLNSKQVILQIAPKNFFSRISKRFGGQDIKTGNPEFNELFRIKGNIREEEAWILLDPSIQQRILNLKEPKKFNLTLPHLKEWDSPIEHCFAKFVSFRSSVHCGSLGLCQFSPVPKPLV